MEEEEKDYKDYKTKRSVSITPDQESWILAKVKGRRFENFSHGVRESIKLLKMFEEQPEEALLKIVREHPEATRVLAEVNEEGED